MKKISVLCMLLTLVPYQARSASPLGDAFDGFTECLAAGAVILVAGGAAVGIAIYKCLSGRYYCSYCEQRIKKDDTYVLVAQCGHRLHAGCSGHQLGCPTCEQAIEKLSESGRAKFDFRHHFKC